MEEVGMVWLCVIKIDCFVVDGEKKWQSGKREE